MQGLAFTMSVVSVGLLLMTVHSEQVLVGFEHPTSTSCQEVVHPPSTNSHSDLVLTD